MEAKNACSFYLWGIGRILYSEFCPENIWKFSQKCKYNFQKCREVEWASGSVVGTQKHIFKHKLIWNLKARIPHGIRDGFGREVWRWFRSLPTPEPLFRAHQPELVAQGLVGRVWNLQGWKFQSLTGQTIPVFVHLYGRGKKKLFCLNGISLFQFVFTVSCPVIGQREEVSYFILFTSPLRYLYTLISSLLSKAE